MGKDEDDIAVYNSERHPQKVNISSSKWFCTGVGEGLIFISRGIGEEGQNCMLLFLVLS